MLSNLQTLPISLIGTWNDQSGIYEPSRSDKWVINEEFETNFTISRQVGDEDSSSVPYPTVCRYNKSGKVISFYTNIFDSYKNYYSEQGYEMPTHSLSYEITKYELVSDSSNDANCVNFIKNRNEDIKKHIPHNFSEYLVHVNNDTLLDPSSKYKFEKDKI